MLSTAEVWARWAHARSSCEWRGLELLEAELAACASRLELPPQLPAFHALLLPLPVAAQTQVAAMHAALYALDPAASAARAAAPHAPGRRRNRPLRVSVLRGSSNQNGDRLASLLSLSPHHFATARLWTTRLESLDAMVR